MVTPKRPSSSVGDMPGLIGLNDHFITKHQEKFMSQLTEGASFLIREPRLHCVSKKHGMQS